MPPIHVATSEQSVDYRDYLTTFGMGYKLNDNLNIGIGYEWFGNGGEDYNSAFAGLKYGSQNVTFDLNVGERKEFNALTYTNIGTLDATTLVRQKYMAGLSVKLFDNAMRLSIGARNSDYFTSGYNNYYAGIRYNLSKDLIFAYGISENDFADSIFFTKYTYNRFGLELKHFLVNGLVLQAGIGEKRFSVISQDENIKTATNLTFGFQYDLFDNISLEFAQKAYKGYLYLEDFDEYGGGSLPIPVEYNTVTNYSIDESNNYSVFSLVGVKIKF